MKHLCGAFCDALCVHKCVVRVGVRSTHSVGCREFPPGNRNHHHFSDDVGCHNSFVIVKLATAKLKMKTLPAGFLVALCSTAIQFSDRHSNRSFLVLRTADLVVDVADVLDVSVSEIVRSPPSEHLAFQGTVLIHRLILVDVEEVSGAHQHSNEESNVWRSATVLLVVEINLFEIQYIRDGRPPIPIFEHKACC